MTVVCWPDCFLSILPTRAPAASAVGPAVWTQRAQLPPLVPVSCATATAAAVRLSEGSCRPSAHIGQSGWPTAAREDLPAQFFLSLTSALLIWVRVNVFRCLLLEGANSCLLLLTDKRLYLLNPRPPGGGGRVWIRPPRFFSITSEALQIST